VAGRGVRVRRPRCEVCGRLMVFWSGYTRPVRSGRVVVRIWVKRARCPVCRASHALLPSFCLLGRLDAVEVIGPAVGAVAEGRGTRTVAQQIDPNFAYTTVRAWCRRYRQRVRRGGEAESVAALERVAGPVAAWLGVPLWSAVSWLRGGRWLSATTDMPLAGGRGWRWMTVTVVDHPRRPP
jgi:Domain of unknown function (DUF6431)